MRQRSKVEKSREEWKTKAMKRAAENREYRKAQKRQLKKIVELNLKISELEQRESIEKTDTAGSVVQIKETPEIRALCVLLVINAAISYRSIPHIFNVFNSKTPLTLSWIPHFTSVINWSLRVGLGLLAQVSPIVSPWLAIIDHSIDIGTKKVLVVLRVKMDALLQRGGAIHLADCECIGIRVREIVNGEAVAEDLTTIFEKAGTPVAIIKDRDATLQKGVRLWSEKQQNDVSVIDDIGHVMATILKKLYEETEPFKQFVAAITTCAARLRQTDLAFLIPPKLRSKGRFQSIGTLGKWAEKMLNILTDEPARQDEKDEPDSVLARFRAAMPDFLSFAPFIKNFSNTVKHASQIMETLKKNGLSDSTYRQCTQFLAQFPEDSIIKTRLQNWLDKHIEIQKRMLKLPLLVSSDIIESLFGNFKHIIERSPQADMNRTVLLIPTLCGNLDETMVTRALSYARHRDLEIWEKENIPYTLRKKRRAFLN